MQKRFKPIQILKLVNLLFYRSITIFIRNSFKFPLNEEANIINRVWFDGDFVIGLTNFRFE